MVASDRLSWQSRGPTPGRAIEALKAAKGELIDLLVRYRLDSAGGLAGDDLLATLRVKGFAVRSYGVNAALDDALGGALQRAPTASLLYAFADKQAEYGLALRALRAPDYLEGNAHPLGEKPAAIGAVRALRPRLRTVQHVGRVSIRTAAAAGCWAVGFVDSRATPRSLGQASRLGLATTVYTVNDAARMREIGFRRSEAGIDGRDLIGVDGDPSDKAITACNRPFTNRRHTDAGKGDD